MLVAAAVCPQPPLLVPQAMGQAGNGVGEAGPGADIDAEIRRLRQACLAAVTGLGNAAPELLIVVGGGGETRSLPGSAAGSLAGHGVPFRTGDGPPVLPLSLTVGAWLARSCLPAVAAGYQEIAPLAPLAERLELGARLAERAGRVALLAMGDGSARKALGVTDDPDADRFDDDAARALAAADAAALAGLEPARAAEVRSAGLAAWQVLAGAAGGDLRGKLSYRGAPLAVTYFVASWTRPVGLAGREPFE